MISKRLEAVASFVSDNVKMIDVGCDHALLDIYLAKERKNIKIIASDINEKPLEYAYKNIKKYHVEDKITIIKNDGIKNIKDIDTIVISGLGGNTMIDILSDKESLKEIKEIIVSPNNSEYLLKNHLIKMGYYINNEILIKDKSIIYIVIHFKKGKKHYSNKTLKYGTKYLVNNSFYKEYINNYKNKYINILKKLPKKNIIKRLKIKKELMGIKNR